MPQYKPINRYLLCRTLISLLQSDNTGGLTVQELSSTSGYSTKTVSGFLHAFELSGLVLRAGTKQFKTTKGKRGSYNPDLWVWAMKGETVK
jgi:DNA-binding IclR family transcriptional regulator